MLITRFNNQFVQYLKYLENMRAEKSNHLKKFYDAMYCTLYEFYENSTFTWLSDWKAVMSMNAVVFFTFLIIYIQAIVFFDEYIHISLFWFNAIGVLCIVVPNHLYFIQSDRWKGLVKNFGMLDRKKRIRIKSFSWMIIVCLLILVALSFYEMSIVFEG